MSARIEYAPGEAWCISAGRVVLVCERDLPAVRARALHDAAAVAGDLDALRTILEVEPAALLGIVDAAGGRMLLRRHGVPATADGEPLVDRFGAEWALDETDPAVVLAAGSLDALAVDALPLDSGVVRVAALRVAPLAAEASPPAADAVDAAAVDAGGALAPRTGAFGETLPPRGGDETSVPSEDRAAGPVAPEAPAAAPVPPEEPEGPQAPRAHPPAASIGGLIDSVPGFIRPAVELGEVDAQGSDADAAPPAETRPGAVAGLVAGDHDGMTITAEQARRLQDERAGAPSMEAATPTQPATGPLVLSILCPAGHVNPPGSGECVRCGAAVDDRTAAQRPRPEVAVAVLPSGERVPLGRGVVLGRRPRSRRAEDGRVPRLVTVESPGEDISRSHLELRLDDWSLIAIDLSSTNGTVLLRDGVAPQRLRPEASTILRLGDRLDMGDGQVIAIEAAP